MKAKTYLEYALRAACVAGAVVLGVAVTTGGRDYPTEHECEQAAASKRAFTEEGTAQLWNEGVLRCAELGITVPLG